MWTGSANLKRYSACIAVRFPRRWCVPGPSETADIIRFCNDNKIAVIPRTGGSSIEGGLEALSPDSIVVMEARWTRCDIDTYDNMQVTCQCGVNLEVLEETLRKLDIRRSFPTVKALGPDGRSGIH